MVKASTTCMYSRETYVSLGPAESREIKLPTVCTDNGGLLPEGSVSLTPFILSLPDATLTNQTAVYAATAGATSGTAADALLHAARMDSESNSGAASPRLKALLSAPWAPPVDALSRATGTSALMDAARAGEHKAVSLLSIVGKASVHVMDSNARTALHHAVRGGVDDLGSEEHEESRTRAASELLERGADVDAADRCCVDAYCLSVCLSVYVWACLYLSCVDVCCAIRE